MKASFVELVLTCGSWQEAQNIADALLEKKLAACIEFLDVKSKYRWQGDIEEANEVKLIMKTVAEKFDVIKAEVAKLHSYETFVLEAIPVSDISDNAARWLQEETHG